MWSTCIYLSTIISVLLVLHTVCGNDSLAERIGDPHKAKLRHSRRSHGSFYENSNNEIFADDVYNSGRNDAMNNHKPVFMNCSQYQPKIKEEAPTGLFVVQVHATDRDPLERGGNITYSIVSAGQDSVKFHIDPTSGVITTVYMFNRDEPAREKEVYVTVRATDNGKPQLDDICRFKITIEDENDNTPTFDKAEYHESIPQDMRPGSEVMRISATDIDDGDNRQIVYDLSENVTAQYFKVDRQTGIVKLDREITDKLPGYQFKFKAFASDKNPFEPKSASVDLIITVVESNKKPPYFTMTPPNVVHLLENFTDYLANIATFVAESNTEEKALRFTLVTGKSEQTNKKDTFRLVSSESTAYIRLGGGVQLDYEELPEYFLTVRVENKYNLAAEHSFTIQLEDVNDRFPMFSKEIHSGVVLENEDPGTPVMQVTAMDLDVSPLFKKITFSLEDNTDKFHIDPETGNITTRVKFDREAVEVYNIKVLARDGAPSALVHDGLPNSATQVFKIDIADRNDNQPKCKTFRYEAEIPEDADLNSKVIEVQAADPDSASTITYSILGNERGDDVPFYIEPETGKIKVKSHLDFEKTKEYLLSVKVHDGVYEDVCKVSIKVTNVNDNAPVFLPFERNITIVEEQLYENCLTMVKAYDPDVGDHSMPQNITYSVVKLEQQKSLEIAEDGCLRMLKPLDRDYPNGSEIWQVFISAADEGGLSVLTEVWITLEDVNDNAPFLRMNQPVVWQENQNPGNITMLEADDYDTPKNGKPFTYRIADEASDDIHAKFRIEGSSLNAKVTFDREEQKEYRVPIAITDNGDVPKTNTSYLTVVIGDENDNPMKEGFSSIFVYFLEGHQIDTQIGRVYVNDPDDWDLPDKKFYFDQGHRREHRFDLDSKTGMLTVSKDAEPQSYMLYFTVTEESSNRLFESHSVSAVVNVTIKLIPEEAVDKSGSIRFEGVTAEEFVTKDSNEENKADILKQQLAIALNNSVDNIDVFTVLHSPMYPNSTNLLDVRFSSHGSPYYWPERINSAIVKHQNEFENALGLRMYMVNVDECLQEKVNCESSCWNELIKSNEPAAVYTNTTSFIGIKAFVQPRCECRKREVMCMNGGTLTSDGRCECIAGFDGPNCEQTSIGFSGTGWALYPPFDVCEEIHIVLYVRAAVSDALIFYAGPDTSNPSSLDVQDFIALELRRGRLILFVDYGSGTAKVEHFHEKIADDNYHEVEIILKKHNIELKVDNCALQTCMNVSPPVGGNRYLNVNGPLQVGGTYIDLNQVALHRKWTHKPSESMNGFSGCVSNFTVNGHLYNLGMPSVAQNADSSCSAITPAGITFGFDWSFFIAILVCLAVLTILLMLVAVHRRKVDDMYKDTDDIRENIINYEDEGGGEGDTAYDMRFLRMQDDDNGALKCPIIPMTEMDEVPDICGFLDGKKHSVDNDPETLPFDDVRHYAYEGDGNTTGSLSSLASGTDEGDLNFDYLSNFGPRFRKLADMYGEDASDEDSDTYHNATSESWC